MRPVAAGALLVLSSAFRAEAGPVLWLLDACISSSRLPSAHGASFGLLDALRAAFRLAPIALFSWSLGVPSPSFGRAVFLKIQFSAVYSPTLPIPTEDGRLLRIFQPLWRSGPPPSDVCSHALLALSPNLFQQCQFPCCFCSEFGRPSTLSAR